MSGPSVAYDQIPEEIQELDIWVGWKHEKRVRRDGSVYRTKAPYNVRTRKYAKSNLPASWSSFDVVRAAHHRDDYDGIGCCVVANYVGGDLDGCLHNGIIEPWARKIVDELDSYTEISPSNEGLRIIVKGELPDGRRQLDFGDRPHHGAAFYEAGGPRFLTITGNRIGNVTTIAERTAELARIHARLFPREPPKRKSHAKTKTGASVSDDELIARASKARNGARFQRLWEGHWEGDYPTQSEADLALCTILSFWCTRDPVRMDRLFRRCGLMREKWNRDEYRDMTIRKAIARTDETWTPGGTASRAAYVDLNQCKPTLELLNAQVVFGGLIQFRAVRRRGPMIIATPIKGQEIIWYSTADLTSFTKSQAILADATGELIATPPRAQVRAWWEPAAQLLLKLSDQDKELAEPPLTDEFRQILRSTWERAGSNALQTDEQFVDLLQEATAHTRDPHGEPPNCCVWMAEGYSWVHLPSLLDWLSCPVAKNRHVDWGEARKALLLLGFSYIKDCHRRCGDEKQGKASVWRGPESLLKD
jgi:hypothetical protein